MVMCYAVTLFTSALLLFLIQPMAGKMLLPFFGGTPAVWNVCMVFFQTFLLLGYGYAHFCTKIRQFRRQIFLHFTLMAIGLAALPFSFDTEPPADAIPAIFLLMQLSINLGLPFFIVSSSAPLLQNWFSRTNHPTAQDPYYLYAASNLGSLIALFGYPLFVEPALRLNNQSLTWTLGYILLIALIGTCGLWAFRSSQSKATVRPIPVGEMDGGLDPLNKPSVRQRFFWIFCAFVPSSMMLGTTTYITTNVAALPLLWVFPLALYLTTFILVFARKKLISQAVLARIAPFAAISFAPFFFFSIRISEFFLIYLHLGMFFLIALVCHGQLAAHRPHPRYLTGFYFWMSVGGVLGGIFNTLIAPLLFLQIIEYPLALLLACMVFPKVVTDLEHTQKQKKDLGRLVILSSALMGLFFFKNHIPSGLQHLVFFLVFSASALVCLSCKERRLSFALAVGILLLASAHLAVWDQGQRIYSSRNFFGVKQVVADRESGIHYLYHGTTVHGAQRIDSHGEITPLTYYHPLGPAADIFNISRSSNVQRKVAVIGLGVGSLASYARPGDHFTFFEIDPEIEGIARNERFFRFLSTIQGNFEVVLGDGRLTINKAKSGEFDVIVLDAFSSDAIPAHLLTREAVAIYLDKLAPEGILLFHISNRFLNLEPLMAGLAKELGLRCLIRDDNRIAKSLEKTGFLPSTYAAMGRPESKIRHLKDNPHWKEIHPAVKPMVWTDQFSNLIQLLK